ncbi:hypothetical protein NDU88_007452 [Pleurodeles waltl]|uniref:Endonuclease/exonuclease/phosphatase domain-containing protein n=1 Tax=Pleurodeles waltl TaxID=8319 RepID=A0AAV7NTM7_PLEWA|nr:hypothetical protein NDU88_007452 [Pleurodeles waltl]
MTFKLLLDKCLVLEGLLIYRPPGPVSKFLSIWPSILEPLIMAPKAIILGDFNIHFDNTRDLLVAEFFNLMEILDWVLKDGMATHRAGHTLDGIFTHPEEDLYLSTTPVEWTDHALLMFKFLARQQPITPIPQKKLIRAWRNIEAEQLKVTLIHNWNEPKVSMLSPLARFNLGISQAMDTLAPARFSASGTRKKPNQPWYSQALKILQRRYRQKERCWKLSLCEADRVDLKLALSSYKEACRVAKSDYFTRKISEATNSSRELFRTVNVLTTPLGTPKVENSQDFCNKVAKFFECKVLDIYSGFGLDKKPANLSPWLTTHLHPGVTMNGVPDKPLLLSKFKMPSHEVLCKLLLEDVKAFFVGRTFEHNKLSFELQLDS